MADWMEARKVVLKGHWLAAQMDATMAEHVAVWMVVMLVVVMALKKAEQ